MTQDRRLTRNTTYVIQKSLEEGEEDTFREQKSLQIQLQLQRPPQQKEKFQYFSEEEEIDANDIILREQQVAIKKIEKDTAEIREMFEDVSILVKLQQIPIDALSHEIKQTKKSVETSNMHLLIAEERHRSRCIVM